MKYILTLFLLISTQLFATENLSKNDYVGDWESDWAAVNGESQKLTINSNNSSVFVRHFKNGEEQILKSETMEIVDDIIIINYKSKENALIYKLVLSGWSSYKKLKLYGTMFMYNNGTQYNGLPITFARGKFGG